MADRTESRLAQLREKFEATATNTRALIVLAIAVLAIAAFLLGRSLGGEESVELRPVAPREVTAENGATIVVPTAIQLPKGNG